MDHIDRSNAEDAKRIHAMILSDKDYVEPREGDSESAEDAMSDDDCCNEVDATDSCFTGQDKTKWGKVKSITHIRCRWQNILTKLPGVTDQTRNITMPVEAWNCLFTDDNIVQYTSVYCYYPT
jgi:hypothetical protein